MVLLAFVLPLVIAAMVSVMSPYVPWSPKGPMFQWGLWSWVLMPFVVGCGLVAGERGSQTITFLRGLPASPFKVWLAKTLFGVGVVVGLGGAYTCLHYVLAHGDGRLLAHWAGIPIALLCFFVGFACSCVVNAPIHALLLGLLGMALSVVCCCFSALSEYDLVAAALILAPLMLLCSYVPLRALFRRGDAPPRVQVVWALLPLTLCIAIPATLICAQAIDWICLDPEDIDGQEGIQVSDDGKWIAMMVQSRNMAPRWLAGERYPCGRILVCNVADGRTSVFPRLPGRSVGWWPWWTVQARGSTWSPGSKRLTYQTYTGRGANVADCPGLLHTETGRHEALRDLPPRALASSWLDDENLGFVHCPGGDTQYELGTYNVQSRELRTVKTKETGLRFLGIQRRGPQCVFLMESKIPNDGQAAWQVRTYDVRDGSALPKEVTVHGHAWQLSPDARWIVAMCHHRQGDECRHSYSLYDLANGRRSSLWEGEPVAVEERCWVSFFCSFSRSSEWALIREWPTEATANRLIRMAGAEVHEQPGMEDFGAAGLSPAGRRIAAWDRKWRGLRVVEAGARSGCLLLDFQGTAASDLAWIDEERLVVSCWRRLLLVDLGSRAVEELWPRKRPLPELRVLEEDTQ